MLKSEKKKVQQVFSVRVKNFSRCLNRIQSLNEKFQKSLISALHSASRENPGVNLIKLIHL